MSSPVSGRPGSPAEGFAVELRAAAPGEPLGQRADRVVRLAATALAATGVPEPPGR